ncbi:MAG: hypothetical protein KF914_13635 [Rhizobiaceae bacterium]|nr:hypothetical protein [Rhizobiaceae bacterium]
MLAAVLLQPFTIADAAVDDSGGGLPLPTGAVSMIPVPIAPFATEQADETYQLAYSPGYTQVIVKALGEVRAECASVPSEYRIDCLAQGLKWAATRQDAPDYERANAILRSAGSKLDSIVKRNLDPAKPALDANTKDNPTWKRPRKYRAVKRANLAAANAEARQVIEGAVAELLRAAESSAERRSHYAKIAAALDSTKTLLRSS